MKKRLLIVGLLLVSYGCITEMDSDYYPVPDRLVLNSLICANQRIEVQVSLPVAMETDSIPVVSNAIVELYENSTHVETIQFDPEKNLYLAQYLPKEGNRYTLSASVEGYPVARGSDSIPRAVQIDTVHFTIRAYFEDNEAVYFSTASIFFQEPAQPNWYESVFEEVTFPSTSNIYLKYRIYQSNDPVILNENILGFSPKSVLFSDQLLSKNAMVSYSVDFNPMNEFPGYFYDNTESKFYITLRTVSENYYLAKKNWYAHRENKSLQGSASFFNVITLNNIPNPIALFSNIENGYGIVAAYTQSHYDVLNRKLIE